MSREEEVRLGREFGRVGIAVASGWDEYRVGTDGVAVDRVLSGRRLENPTASPATTEGAARVSTGEAA